MAMTVEELAKRSGQTVRNIRSYQTRGLLPPPDRLPESRRVAAYGDDHFERLKLIGDLRRRGFSLAAIAELVQVSEGRHELSALLGMRPVSRRTGDSGRESEPVEVGADELAEMIGEIATNPALQARAISLGLLEPKGERYLIPSPDLIETGGRLMAVGVSAEALFDALDSLQQGIRGSLRIIAESFRMMVWEPSSGSSPRTEDVEAAISMIAELPRLTRDAVDAALDHEIRNAPLVRLLTRNGVQVAPGD